MHSSKARTWVALGLVLALVGSSVLITIFNLASSEETSTVAVPTPSPSPEPRPSDLPELTRAEAAAEFERLHDLANKLTRQRDGFFIEQVFTASGPMLERSRARISELIQDQVLDHSRTSLEKIRVRALGEGEATILSVAHLSPCFVTEMGEDVTQDTRVVRNEIVWTMRWEDGGWKLHDAELRDQSKSERARKPCKR